MRSLLVILALTPFAAFADTFLCVPDVGALVKDGDGKPASAHIADVSQEKFILTRENGNWGVKRIGTDFFLLNQCEKPSRGVTPYFCDHTDGYAGAFVRKDDGRFWVTWMSRRDGFEMLIVAKGRCSKI